MRPDGRTGRQRKRLRCTVRLAAEHLWSTAQSGSPCSHCCHGKEHPDEPYSRAQSPACSFACLQPAL
jgi:hypothetical protein